MCPTLNAMDNGSESRATVLTVMGDVTHALTHEGHDASEDGTGRGTPVIAFGHTQDLDPQTSESVSPTLRSNGGGAAVSAYGFSGGNSAAAYGIGLTEDGTPPLRASASGSNQVPTVAHGAPMQVRRLTPRECERLQGFPDDWTAIGSDSARYKQMGNAVTVNVATYVARLIDTWVRESA